MLAIIHRPHHTRDMPKPYCKRQNTVTYLLQDTKHSYILQEIKHSYILAARDKTHLHTAVLQDCNRQNTKLHFKKPNHTNKKKSAIDKTTPQEIKPYHKIRHKSVSNSRKKRKTKLQDGSLF